MRPSNHDDDAGPTLAASQAAGFPMGGESLAIDLADTLVTVTEPALDLLADEAASERFWRLHADSLPANATPPSLDGTRRLRDAVRGLLDAAQRGAAPRDADVRVVNATAEAAPVSLQLDLGDGRPTTRERWHATDASRVSLAAAARSTIEFLADPVRRAALRRCASPSCSMLFVKGDGRRRWCTPNICGNRDRAARHYRRHRDDRTT